MTPPYFDDYLYDWFSGSNREAQAFLTRHSVTEGGTQIIVRMRGLPYTCTAEQVVRILYYR